MRPTKVPFALGLSRPILDAMSKMGVVTPTPIQALAIPHVLAGRDVLARHSSPQGQPCPRGQAAVSGCPAVALCLASG